jgi:exodeoxyribonuclease V alpha subunit
VIGRAAHVSRFRHNRGQRLPHDVVIVDETSMVSLSPMARLVEAIRPDARLILVGDPGQLASIEAGADLGVGPAAERLRIRAEARTQLTSRPATRSPPTIRRWAPPSATASSSSTVSTGSAPASPSSP